MDARGWTASETDLLEIRFLDWVASYDGSPKVPAALGFYPDPDNVTDDEARSLKSLVSDLQRRGLIAGHQVGAWFHAMLTSEGRQVVRHREARRTSRRDRSIAAREALLDWMYDSTSDVSGESPDIQKFIGTTRAHIDGDPFTDSDIVAATKYLREEGYITGIGSWGGGLARPSVTAKGLRAVETECYTAGPEVQRTTINTVNISGDNLGQAGAGQVTQQQTNAVDGGGAREWN